MAIRIITLLILLLSNIAFAEKSIKIISDAEIENKLKSFIAPLVKAANLNPNNIKIRIVIDNSLNAFVTNGTDMFINSGLLIRFAQDPNILYAVMAHEIAHIYAGHLISLRGELEDTSKLSMGGALIGLATVLAGAPDAGIFIGAASMNAGMRTIMQYSREHEVEADKISVNLLYKTHNNGEGLIKFFRYLNNSTSNYDGDPYLRTHPLNNDRIISIQNSIKEKLSKFGDNITPQIRSDFKRIALKLEAFMMPVDNVLSIYKNNKYASSIGYFRSGKLNTAIDLLDKVIAEEPHDPYLFELKAQFYYENGKFNQSSMYYQKALSFLPNDKIIKLELAYSKINQANGAKDAELLNYAIKLLKQVIVNEPENIIAYFMLSRAYGKLNMQNRAILSLSEYYFYQHAYTKSQILAKKALKGFPENSREYLRANDIILLTKDLARRGE